MPGPIANNSLNIASNDTRPAPAAVQADGQGFETYLADNHAKQAEPQKTEAQPAVTATNNTDALAIYMQQIKDISANQQF